MYRECEVKYEDFSNDLIEKSDEIKFSDLKLIFQNLKGLFKKQGYEINWKEIEKQSLDQTINTLSMASPFSLEEKQVLLESKDLNLQKYFPGDHFAALHSERTGLSTLHRIFAFMTYLNDVNDGGTTNFDHYGLKIKPEQNKTLIWPAEWTHAHRGNVLNSDSKYIITGWMHFPNKVDSD